MSIIGKRNLYYDFLRGISILLVVAIHTSKLPEIFNDITDYCALGIFQIAMVAVPVFLVISGFFLSEKKLDSKDEIVSFWKKQIPKVYVPMLIWALPIVLLQIVNGKNPLFSIFSWVTGGIGANYFVILIIQCYLLLPLLKNIKWGG